MKESIERRIEAIKNAGDDVEELKKYVCPFFVDGDCPGCNVCRKDGDTVIGCRDQYLSNINAKPMDIYEEGFLVYQAQERGTVSVDEVRAIGTNCDRCYISDKCPLYRQGFVCGIDWKDKTQKSSAELLDFLIDTQYERVRRASAFEKIDGGVPDANLSREMDRLSAYLIGKANLNMNRVSVSVEASSPAISGGGILSRLFGAPTKEEPKEIEEKSSTEKTVLEITDVEAHEVPIKKKRVEHST